MHSRYYRSFHTASPRIKHIPIHGGVSVYVKIPGTTKIFIGTLSGVVINKSTGKRYLLSNQHVFFPYQSGSPNIKPGLPVFAVGDSRNPVAKTTITKAEQNPWSKSQQAQALSSIGDYHDSALAEALVPVSMEVNTIGIQKSAVEPIAGMKIKYYGEASGLQRGTIDRITTSVDDVVGGKISVRKNIIVSNILEVWYSQMIIMLLVF